MFDDLARRINQTAGCIDLDQYGLIAAAAGFVDCAGDVFLADGLDRVVDDDFQDFGLSGEGEENGRCNGDD